LAKDSTRVRIVGWICLVFALLVFVAPLCIVIQVIRTKSAEYMPLPLSAFLAVNAVAWFFYGLLLKDFYIAIPNVLGFVFGVLQMVLYKIYSKSEKVPVVLRANNDGLQADKGLNVQMEPIKV
ncbi:unnamed protein product, partial [Coffea canephora]